MEGSSHWPAGSFYVKFDADRCDHGWFALEFLAWVINNDCDKAGMRVELRPISNPPYLNSPGQTMHFVVEGYKNEDPQKLAKLINRLRSEYYFSPEDLDQNSDEAGESMDPEEMKE